MERREQSLSQNVQSVSMTSRRDLTNHQQVVVMRPNDDDRGCAELVGTHCVRNASELVCRKEAAALARCVERVGQEG